MSWRAMLLVGMATFVVALGLALALVRILAPDQQLLTGAAIVALFLGPVSIGVLGFLAGWFGHEYDLPVVVAIGFGAAAAVVLGALSFFVTDWRIAVAVLGVGAAIIAAVVGRLTWWFGNAVCEIRGLPTGPALVAPAYPDEVGADGMWTTRAGARLRSTLDELADRIASDQPVAARAVGVSLGFPRDRPVVVALGAGGLAIQPVDLEGAPTGDATIVDGAQLAEVSIRSLAADGSARRQINAFDDIIVIRTVGGDRSRLRLPYGSRGAGTTTGGPNEIREWLRTTTATYR